MRVHEALAAGYSGPKARDAAVGRVVALSSGPEGRRAVRRVLIDLLRECLGSAWWGGWQPADVHRLAARRGSGLTVHVVCDAMVDEVARYAAGTVDPRWHAQLGQLEATAWWPGDGDYLTARASTAPEGWREVVPAALTAVELLAELPQIQQIGPLPGRATPADQAAAERAGAVDDRILGKVRALLAKAEATTFEAEAETFTAGAQALMARHSIDAAMLDAERAKEQGPAATRIGIDRPYERPKAMLLAAVADANRCRTVWSEHLGFCTVLGFAHELRMVETLFTSLLVQATQAVGREGSRQTRSGQSRTRSFRQSFLTAFAARIGERLREVTQAEVASATGDGSAAGPDARRYAREVLPVLAARSQAVDDATEAMFPDLTERAVGRVSDVEGWYSGRAAADQASLEQLSALAAR